LLDFHQRYNPPSGLKSFIIPPNVMSALRQASRVLLKRNPNYRPHGKGSYVWLMKKYNIKPTQPGPIQNQNGRLVKVFSDGTTGDV